MKKLFLSVLFSAVLPFGAVFAQNSDALRQSLLFDDSDVIVKAPAETPAEVKPQNNKQAEVDAVNSARRLLNQKPVKLRQKSFPKMKTKAISPSAPKSAAETKDAPFGLLWGADIAETRNQGVQLSATEMKDYINSFQATRLPKPIALFDRIYVVYGKEDELYRILAYSRLIDDDASASKALLQYNTFSELLNKKYGNKQEDFTPAVISKTIKNAKGQDETVEEKAPIGNPDFLEQLMNGTAVLFSTYYNQDVAAALSIGVDGDKKSYIVIDYKNLRVLEKQEAKTLDAL